MLERDEAQKRFARPRSPRGLSRPPTLGWKLGHRGFQGLRGEGRQGHTPETRVSLPGSHYGPLGPSPLTCAPYQRSPAPFAGGRTGGLRSAPPFPAFPGLCAHRPQPKQTASPLVPRIPPTSAGAQSACALLSQLRPHARPAAPSPERAQAQNPRGGLAVQWDERARSAEGEARSRPALLGHPIGRRFPRKSQLPPRNRPPLLTRLLQELYGDGCGRAFHFIKVNCWDQGKEDKDRTRRR